MARQMLGKLERKVQNKIVQQSMTGNHFGNISLETIDATHLTISMTFF